MPVVRIISNVALDADKKAALLQTASKLAVKITGKPETYVQALYESGGLMFGGTEDAAAFADVFNIGMQPDQIADFAKELTKILEQAAGVPPNRFFLNFHNPGRADWGYDGRTFA